LTTQGRERIAKTGFPLELRVANLLTGNKYQVAGRILDASDPPVAPFGSLRARRARCFSARLVFQRLRRGDWILIALL
jgi:hypothetical protein